MLAASPPVKEKVLEKHNKSNSHHNKIYYNDYTIIILNTLLNSYACLASSPGLQLCGGKAWYRLHAHVLDFRILCRKIVRKRTGPQYPYVFGFCRFCRMLAHAHAVDTRPSLRIIEGLGTRLMHVMISVLNIIVGLYIIS